jgi:hypothetical protein
LGTVLQDLGYLPREKNSRGIFFVIHFLHGACAVFQYLVFCSGTFAHQELGVAPGCWLSNDWKQCQGNIVVVQNRCAALFF